MSMTERIAPSPRSRSLGSLSLGISVIPGEFRYVSGCLETSQMSACRVIAQKGRMSSGTQ